MVSIHEKQSCVLSPGYNIHTAVGFEPAVKQACHTSIYYWIFVKILLPVLSSQYFVLMLICSGF